MGSRSSEKFEKVWKQKIELLFSVVQHKNIWRKLRGASSATELSSLLPSNRATEII